MKFAILDTNHYSALTDHSELGAKMRTVAELGDAELFTTIIDVQEVPQGWFAWINGKSPGAEQIHGYAEFQRNLEAFSRITVLPFDQAAAWYFNQLRQQRIRIGTMDMKIAAICLAHDATLLSRNLVDFEKVPSLKIENWLD